MDRREYLEKLVALGVCTCAYPAITIGDNSEAAAFPQDDELTRVKSQKQFIENWLTDLLEAIDTKVDQTTRIALMEACGKGCYRRHSFKQDIAAAGRDNLEKLIEAYKKNFEIWKDENIVHIRYGEVSSHCYCPAANYRPAKPNDLHCECTRSTHQTIFENALGRSCTVDIVESLRRGGKTCHFAVHIT
jgi:hypothetical protein